MIVVLMDWFLKVLLNGQSRFEHFAFNDPGWVDGRISLSEFAGETVLLEISDRFHGETISCDWAHWADLFITAKGVESSGDVNQGRNSQRSGYYSCRTESWTKISRLIRE